MCPPRPSRTRFLVFALLLGGCYVTTKPGAGLQLSSGGHGYTFSPGYRGAASDSPNHEFERERPDPKLDTKGARVAVAAAPPPGCILAGYVTGVAGREQGRLLRSEAKTFVAKLPREVALISARNEAGKQGLSAIVVDGHSTLEYHQPVDQRSFIVLYARAFRCPQQ